MVGIEIEKLFKRMIAGAIALFVFSVKVRQLEKGCSKPPNSP